MLLIILLIGLVIIIPMAARLMRPRIRACPACKVKGSLVRPPREHLNKPAYGWECMACAVTLDGNGQPRPRSVFD